MRTAADCSGKRTSATTREGGCPMPARNTAKSIRLGMLAQSLQCQGDASLVAHGTRQRQALSRERFRS